VWVISGGFWVIRLWLFLLSAVEVLEEVDTALPPLRLEAVVWPKLISFGPVQ
jgi:hypothetical protein